jgi:hypothetical protein
MRLVRLSCQLLSKILKGSLGVSEAAARVRRAVQAFAGIIQALL